LYFWPKWGGYKPNPHETLSGFSPNHFSPQKPVGTGEEEVYSLNIHYLNTRPPADPEEWAPVQAKPTQLIRKPRVQAKPAQLKHTPAQRRPDNN
jgi:hypothetical protein